MKVRIQQERRGGNVLAFVAYNVATGRVVGIDSSEGCLRIALMMRGCEVVR